LFIKWIKNPNFREVFLLIKMGVKLLNAIGRKGKKGKKERIKKEFIKKKVRLKWYKSL
jgi:hypothetical protein